MDSIILWIEENWATIVPLFVAIAAFVATLLKAPTEESSEIYKLVYKFINWLALNVGNAVNADDVEAQKKL